MTDEASVPIASQRDASPELLVSSNTIILHEIDDEDEPTVKYNGKKFRAIDLLERLTSEQVKEISYKAPRSLQEFWNAAAKRWPRFAADIARSIPELCDTEIRLGGEHSDR